MIGPHRRRTLRRRITAGLLLFALAGCSVGPDYATPRFPFSTKFTVSRNAAPVLLTNAAWWRKFNDPILDQLVDAALRNNLDLEIARERVTEARALAGTVAGPLSLTGEASALHRGGAMANTQNGVQATLGLGWLFDPYGGLQARRDAAAARIEVADAELDAARLLLLSSLTTAYVDLRYAQYALYLRHQELRSRRRTLQLVRDLLNAGATTRLDLIRAEALVAETKVQIPGLEAAIRTRAHEIAVLLGQAPGSLTIPAGSGLQPRASLSADIGIPADLVRNRPDIRISERLYYAAIADIGAARADLYPTLSLGGTVSLSAFSGVESNTFSIGPSVRLPALPNGPRAAAAEVAESRARQAHTTWTSTVLGAIRDVESALADYAGSQAAVQAAHQSVRLYSETVSLTREMITGGEATVRDLLDAEQGVAAARISLASGVRDLALDFVALNVSLGSGNGYEAVGDSTGLGQ